MEWTSVILRVFLVFCLSVYTVYGTVRHYYIAAVEVDWNYAPSGRNMVGLDTSTSREKLDRRVNRIGSTYRKVLYKGYTDSSFRVPIRTPSWAGLLGPTIKAEVDDIVYIHFRNMASKRNFSVHPHGFFYNKANEGALYIDGESGTNKLDDAVPPGGRQTYVWHAARLHAPTKDDDNCVAWGYHSHTMASIDIDTGLVGLALICRKGTLRPDGRRKDVDRELYLYADIADENKNWYINQNMKRCGNPGVCRALRRMKNQPFEDSNTMYHINGYVYGNLPDFPACVGEKVVWYFMSLNLGVHTMHVNGQTMVVEGKRVDTVAVHSASFYSGYTRPSNPGRWLVYCRNSYHNHRGMLAFLDARRCPGKSKVRKMTPRSKYPTRTYYIAIEEVLWNYAAGLDKRTSAARKFLYGTKTRIGSVYKKAVYREYTDKSFKRRRRLGQKGKHYALSGPPIKAQVGDSVSVVILNKASRPYSFLANGVTITKQNEGAVYKNNRRDRKPTGQIVRPGAVRTYRFTVTPNDAPTRLDEPCTTYSYHSAVDLQRDIYSGLYGPLIVCKPGTLNKKGMQIGANREFFLNWMVVDENLSWYIDENINAFTSVTRKAALKRNQDFVVSNRIRAINGRSFGTLTGLRMCVGDRIIWHMYGLGERFDHHHFNFDGNNFHHDNRQIDTSSVFPGIGKTVTMVADQTGRLMLRTGQLEYESEGMFAWYEVMMCSATGAPKYLLPPRHLPMPNGMVRRYYIGAVEVDWDYCSVKIDPVTGKSLWDPSTEGYKYIRSGPNFVGSIYRKSVFREFTDDTFTTVTPRSADEKHLGLLGPFIRGNVGDRIEIIFSNMASHPYSLVPKNIPFSDGSPISNAVPTMPHESSIYSYVIPKRSGPTKTEPNCVGYTYSSRVHPVEDTNSGLFGPLVVCKKGILDMYGKRTDKVTKEFGVAFVIMDENKSHYSRFNFKTRAPARRNYTNPEFVESNKYYSMNGLIYNNLKGLVFNEGEISAWYIFGVGSTTGIHTVHYHGQLYVHRTTLKLTRDVLEVFSGTYETISMLGYNPGTWLLHCHVSLHAERGMKATYTVLPRRRRLGKQRIMHNNNIKGIAHSPHNIVSIPKRSSVVKKVKTVLKKLYR